MAWQVLGDGLPLGLGPRTPAPPQSQKPGKSSQRQRAESHSLPSLPAQAPALQSWLLQPLAAPCVATSPPPPPPPSRMLTPSTPLRPSRPGLTALLHCSVSNTPHHRQAPLASLENSAGQHPPWQHRLPRPALPGHPRPVPFHKTLAPPWCCGGITASGQGCPRHPLASWQQTGPRSPGLPAHPTLATAAHQPSELHRPPAPGGAPGSGGACRQAGLPLLCTGVMP